MSRIIAGAEKLAGVIDAVLNVPFDYVRPYQIRFSDRLGRSALLLQEQGHTYTAGCVARCCEIVAIEAQVAIDRTYDELQVVDFDPQRVRPESIDVVARIVAMNQERLNNGEGVVK